MARAETNMIGAALILAEHGLLTDWFVPNTEKMKTANKGKSRNTAFWLDATTLRTDNYVGQREASICLMR